MYCRYFKASWVLASLARDAEGALTAAKLHESYFNLVLKFVTSLKIQLKSNRGICPPCANCLVFLRCRAKTEKYKFSVKKRRNYSLKYFLVWISIDLQVAGSHWLSGHQLFIHFQIHCAFWFDKTWIFWFQFCFIWILE